MGHATPSSSDSDGSSEDDNDGDSTPAIVEMKQGLVAALLKMACQDATAEVAAKAMGTKRSYIEVIL